MKKRIYDFMLKHPNFGRRMFQIPLLALCAFVGIENGFFVILFWIAIGYMRMFSIVERDIEEYSLLKMQAEHHKKFTPFMRKIDEQLDLLEENKSNVPPTRILH